MVELTAQSACDGLLPVTDGMLALREVAFPQITSLAAFAGQRADLSKALMAAHGVGFPAPNTTTRNGDVLCVWTGREQAFLMGVAADDGLGAFAAVTDQSDAWAVVDLVGLGAEDALARLVPVDLRETAFPEGAALRTQLGHMNVVLIRIDEAIRIMAFRSMAATLVHEVSVAMGSVAARGSAR